jgi:hypothetical protein
VQSEPESELARAYARLDAWCGEQSYAGYDPFDALNSRLFRAVPLVHSSRAARLVWTQVFKRSPVNLRRLAGVPAEKNAKGTALFALAALSEFRRTKTAAAETKARALLQELLAARLHSQTGAACWGYNFDWQGRAFFAPKGTPTIVPTAFAARALLEAARLFEAEDYLRAARSACDFILRDLNLTEANEREVCWSYSPLDRTRVFNASLLAAETLAGVASLTGETALSDWAVRGVRFVAGRQQRDGSWAYGADSFQSWSDNFHTAFILTSFARIIERNPVARDEFGETLGRGYRFWQERFFLSDGWPKYYPDRLYPADAHAAGAGLVALSELEGLDASARARAGKIALWSIRHLQSGRGFFYYQRRRFYTVRTPYMRWSQAWMLYGLARLMESKQSSDKP